MWQVVGLDPAALLAQREQLVQARMARRRADLEAMPATLPSVVKTRALAELRALNLVEFQAQVRAWSPWSRGLRLSRLFMPSSLT